MEREPYLSLCIPTNGVLEWVMPVLESIYTEECNTEEFEVIVTDNGNNSVFENAMIEFSKNHINFIYQKTTAVMFLNQIESFKLAKGMLIKFINHRMILLPKTVNYLVDFAKKHCVEKPVSYFANGVLDLGNENTICNSFDEFVRRLSYWSSWSAGTAIWKEDFAKIDLIKDFNETFPHTDIIFSNKNNKEYVINNKLLLKDIEIDDTKKGKYDLFKAFAVSYPEIVESLLDEKFISQKTFEYIKRENGIFVGMLFFNYVIRKKPCSYDLEGYKDSLGRYYIDMEVKKYLIVGLTRKFIEKIFRNKKGL